MAAEHLRQLVANDFDHLLARRKRGKDLFAHGLFLHLLNKLLDDLEMNVGLKKSYANFAKSLLHVGGGQFSFAAQVFKDPLQLVGQVIEHDWNSGLEPGRSAKTLLIGRKPTDYEKIIAE